jgi:hypothetical protein
MPVHTTRSIHHADFVAASVRDAGIAPVTPPHFLRLYAGFAAAYLLSYVYRTVNAVISPDLSADLGVSASSLGLLTSVYFLAFAATQLPAGMLLDRYGPRRVEPVLLTIADAALRSPQRQPDRIGICALISRLAVCLMAPLKATWYPQERQASFRLDNGGRRDGCAADDGAIGRRPRCVVLARNLRGARADDFCGCNASVRDRTGYPTAGQRSRLRLAVARRAHRFPERALLVVESPGRDRLGLVHGDPGLVVGRG